MIEFNDLLDKAGIDPRHVVAMRHQPTEPLLRKELRRLALEDEPTYIDYQSSHGPRTEAALLRAKYIASFVADNSGKALFIGLYEIERTESAPWNKFLENPRLQMLVGLGSRPREGRGTIVWFHQRRVETFYSEWKGRLVAGWPPPDRAWFRRAERNVLPIIAIHDEQTLVSRLADWDQLVFTWAELKILPRRHAESLEGWRGIYFIRDISDGKAYVGSAYGADNLLGRWLSYGSSGHGGNVLLKGRDAKNFQFSILERLAETADPKQVIARENSWKVRLGTRAPQGLNAN